MYFKYVLNPGISTEIPYPNLTAEYAPDHNKLNLK